MKKNMCIILILTCFSSYAVIPEILSSWQVVRDASVNSLNYMAEGGVNYVTDMRAVQAFSNFRVDPTAGFKVSVALLGMWAIPLACNLASWQWKKYKVKRMIGMEPTEANIRRYYRINYMERRVKELSATMLNIVPEELPSQLHGGVPQDLVNAMIDYDNLGIFVEGNNGVLQITSEEDRLRIDERIKRDVAAATYQPILAGEERGDLHRDTPRLIPCAAGNTLVASTVYAKRQVYDVGLQVLWHNFAYGPGKLTTWLLLGGTEMLAFCGLYRLSNKIFNCPLWNVRGRLVNGVHRIHRDPYMRIGEHLFLAGCLYLNLMLIDKCVTQRLV